MRTYGGGSAGGHQEWVVQTLAGRKDLEKEKGIPVLGDPDYDDRVLKLAEELLVGKESIEAAIAVINSIPDVQPAADPVENRSQPLASIDAERLIRDYPAESLQDLDLSVVMATVLYNLICSNQLTAGTVVSNSFLRSAFYTGREDAARDVIRALTGKGMLTKYISRIPSKVAQGPHAASLEEVLAELPQPSGGTRRKPRAASVGDPTQPGSPASGRRSGMPGASRRRSPPPGR